MPEFQADQVEYGLYIARSAAVFFVVCRPYSLKQAAHIVTVAAKIHVTPQRKIAEHGAAVALEA